MAKKKNTRKKTVSKKKQEQMKRQNWSVVLLALGLLLFALAILEGDSVWAVAHRMVFSLFGWGAFLIGPILVYISVMLTARRQKALVKVQVIQGVLLVLLLGSISHVIGSSDILLKNSFKDSLIECYSVGQSRGGGVLACVIVWPLLKLCGVWGTGVVVAILTLVFIMLVFGLTIVDLWNYVNRARSKLTEISAPLTEKNKQISSLPNLTKKDKAWLKDIAKSGSELQARVQEPFEAKSCGSQEEALKDWKEKAKLELETKVVEKNEAKPEQDEFIDLISNKSKKKGIDLNQGEVESEKKQPFDVLKEPEGATGLANGYVAPSFEFLKLPKPYNTEKIEDELRVTAAKLTETLKSFGVGATISDISCGPSVTRYELQPSVGVKISKITGLADDIALNLAAAGVRIEAPIPNKAAVGIEVPNKITGIVNIREIIESQEFARAKSKLTIALGKDISGNISVADISKMPHVLIAGSTGSGKSVCINSIIVSLLYKASPEDVKLLLIDPKVVELGGYNGIPHLLIPVVTDPRKAAGALGWAVCEMLNRYKLFAENSVRDLKRYNELAKTNEELKKLPQIVIIIDELADLMMVAPNNVEDSICRLAQMARAAGMHLVIATQRPSVDVITGVIKANIPTRVAFAVSSQVDSRTILDCSGAEKLVGRGDMLFLPVGLNKPTRIQGCFVSDSEVEQVVDFLKEESVADYSEDILEEIENQVIKGKLTDKSDVQEDSKDEMLDLAIKYVIKAGQASTSLLQRKLKVGYSRAARIIDEMEEMGVVSESEGSRPRKVLISKQEWLEWQNRKED